MSKKILIVDDEVMVREVLKDFFEMESFEVFEASNGKEAFELIKLHDFACVVSDVRMPNGDGIELAKNIKDLNRKNQKIVLITGYSDISALFAEEIGAADVISKPFNPRDLVKLIIRILAENVSH